VGEVALPLFHRGDAATPAASNNCAPPMNAAVILDTELYFFAAALLPLI